jgi:hypothetical protein
MRLVPYPRIHRAGAELGALLAIASLTPLALISVASASTSLTVTISNGGKYSAAAARVILTDTHSHFPTACSTIGSTPGSQTTGAIINGSHSGAAPVKVGKAASLVLHNCSSGLLGQPGDDKEQEIPYNINVDSATNSKGETDLIISGINFSWSSAGCAFSITGSARGYYTAATSSVILDNGGVNIVCSTSGSTPASSTMGILKNGTHGVTAMNKAQLTISGVHGCFGVWKDGNHPELMATYPLNIPVRIRSS